MILRYEVNGGSADGAIEKRFCHTTGVNNDCFRIPWISMIRHARSHGNVRAGRSERRKERGY